MIELSFISGSKNLGLPGARTHSPGKANPGEKKYTWHNERCKMQGEPTKQSSQVILTSNLSYFV